MFWGLKQLEPDYISLDTSRKAASGSFFSDNESTNLLVLEFFKKSVNDMVLIFIEIEVSNDIRVVDMEDWEAFSGPEREIEAISEVIEPFSGDMYVRSVEDRARIIAVKEANDGFMVAHRAREV